MYIFSVGFRLRYKGEDMVRGIGKDERLVEKRDWEIILLLESRCERSENRVRDLKVVMGS